MHVPTGEIAVNVRRNDGSTHGAAEFQRFFLAHWGEVYRLLFRIVGSRAEAEDLLQEAFLRWWRQPAPLPEGVSARAWIFRVATNLAFNHTRDRRRLDARHAEAGLRGSVPSAPPRPDDTLVRKEERERVRAALDRLPDRQARLLLLRHSGLSYREVAEALDLAASSIGTLLSRAEAAFERAYRGR